MAVPSMPVKRWNFRKAKWSHYIALTNKFAKTLLPPDSLDVDAAYQDFCNTIKKAAKKTIPRGYQNNYILLVTLLVTFPVQPMLLHLSWLEMGNTRLLIASHLDLSLKKCLTFGGPQQQTQ